VRRAVLGNAGVVVTGDGFLLGLGAYGEVRILTAREYVVRLDQAAQQLRDHWGASHRI
jgi:hypothetical protein